MLSYAWTHPLPADAVRHFAHEVRVLARLRHPNLILFIGYCLRPEPAILYEFMPRGSLFNIMRQVCGLQCSEGGRSRLFDIMLSCLWAEHGHRLLLATGIGLLA